MPLRGGGLPPRRNGTTDRENEIPPVGIGSPRMGQPAIPLRVCLPTQASLATRADAEEFQSMRDGLESVAPGDARL